MADMNLNLRERTTVITGPLTNLTQNIASLFTQNGSDVVFIDKNVDACQRMAGVLNDQREINEKYGRAAAVKCEFDSAKACHEALSQAAQTFGSIDIYIDTLFAPGLAPVKSESAIETFEELVNTELKPSFYFAQQVVAYLKNRKRGRLVFLVLDGAAHGSAMDTTHSLLRGGMMSFAKSLSYELADQSTTANVLCVGPTEEYLLKHFPGSTSIKEALEKFKTLNPQAKLVNSDSVAGTLIYLCSAMGNAINGQTLTLL
jgi:2-hydroxycyclohexanecarboxyl-CoA dehydrogenase